MSATPVGQTAANACSLYIHIPWCIKKCPYCDFNSHRQTGALDENRYLSYLLEDFKQEWDLSGKQVLTSIFIGGGTPSIMSASFYEDLLNAINRIVPVENIEITLEANPGTADAGNFMGYRKAGINRLSIGVQSFDNVALQTIGRIHDGRQAVQAFEMGRMAGFDNINLDLMFALPAQTVDRAMADLQRAVALKPEHLSWYQLTLEPNTPFYARPPEQVPDDDLSWDMQQAGQIYLREQGYQQYEISAYSRPGRACQHNLNYWRFGDYIGIGAGAHGKLTLANRGVIRRTKKRGPLSYQTENPLSQQTTIPNKELLFEYVLNRFRLFEPIALTDIEAGSGIRPDVLENRIRPAVEAGLLKKSGGMVQVTGQGHRFLNDLLTRFLE